MNGITSLLDLSSNPIQPFSSYIIDILLIILPKLRYVNFSNRCVTTYPILGQFLDNCPPLEIVTSNNSGSHTYLSGLAMKTSNNLKEIHMDNSNFIILWNKDRFANLNKHQDVFIFHECCKALEHVSIRYMNWNFSLGHNFNNDEDRKLILIQNILIKFVRNAPPTLHWFRSDLTLDNMTMLRMERPGIELLN